MEAVAVTRKVIPKAPYRTLAVGRAAIGMEAMASKGETKLNAKLTGMKSSYNASSGRAQTNFAAVGFGPTRTSNYRNAWTFMPGHYDAGMTSDKVAKWRANWLAILLGPALQGQ